MSHARQTAVLSVVETVAVAKRTATTDLPPVAGAVDPDALNRMFDSADAKRGGVSVTFPYAGRMVTVSSTGGDCACTVSAVLTADGGVPADGATPTAGEPTAD